MKSKSKVFVCAVLTAVVTSSAASAAEYVLVAPHWGNKQNAAVAAAGGTVVWSHAKVGVGMVSSEAPAFLADVLAGNAFNSGAQDLEVQWQPQDFAEELVTPGDEGFYPYQWNVRSIDAPGAWAAGCDGAGARVAVLDGGIYNTHFDLAANMDNACSISFVPGQPFNNDTGTFWHGTHVAGIVAAADNGFGVIGVAPRATILGVKVLHGGSGSFGQVIGGILYAADPAAFGLPGCQRADVINMSLGALFPKNATGGGQLLAAMAKAINFAGSQGVLVVSSAGNEYTDLSGSNLTHVPSDAGSGLSITATGPAGFAYGATNFTRPADYSNYGNGHVSVAAPGGDFSLFPDPNYVFDMVLSTCKGTSIPPSYSFCFSAGTSMAAPAASGVAALIVAANPGISLGALKAQLLHTADDEGPNGTDAFYGHGYVNAGRACTE